MDAVDVAIIWHRLQPTVCYFCDTHVSSTLELLLQCDQYCKHEYLSKAIAIGFTQRKKSTKQIILFRFDFGDINEHHL